MKAYRKRRQNEIENTVALNHQAAQMNAMAGVGKLAPLDDWLRQVRPRKKRSVSDMIQTLRDAAARGAPITIKQSKEAD